MGTKMTFETYLKNLIQEYVENWEETGLDTASMLWLEIMALSFGLSEPTESTTSKRIFTRIKINAVSSLYVEINYYDALYIIYYKDLVRFWLKSKKDLYSLELLDDDKTSEKIIIESMSTIILDDLEGIVLSYIESLTPYVCPHLKKQLSKSHSIK